MVQFFRIAIVLFLNLCFCYLPNGEKEEGEGEIWAVIIAGANTIWNYWSQAQSCAAYQQLHSAGIPDERVIHWLYDDVATDPLNPYPGKIYLYPGGPDVYEGIVKDLTGDEITPENLQDLLTGKDMEIGSKKSLKSGPNDRIFFYLSDHGGDGIIFLPGAVEWHLEDFLATLQTMHEKKMYKEMVIYLDTCHSGSMFNGHLDPSWNIYAATSADPAHVAWLCDCLKLEKFQTCMSNCWGKFWIQDTLYAMGNGTMDKRTLFEQYETVRKQSHHPNPLVPSRSQTACNYGNMDIANRTLNYFQSDGNVFTDAQEIQNRKRFGRLDNKIRMNLAKHHGLRAIYEETNTHESKIELEEYEEMMRRSDEIWNKFAEYYSLLEEENSNEDYFDCYPKAVDPKCQKEAVNVAKSVCGSFNQYTSQYLRFLTRACHAGIAVNEIKDTLEKSMRDSV